MRKAAEAAGLSVRFWTDLEAGRANIALTRLAAAARAVGTSASELLAAAEEPGGGRASARVAIDRLLSGRTPEELRRCARILEAALGASEAQPRTVALLGLRGAGKSTVGAALAQRLGVAFVELDERIEDEAGLSLSEIFSLHGEEYHRRLSLRCLAELLGDEEPCVVALPGGIVHEREAFELVRRRCLTVWLRALPEEHFARVLAQGDRRPMAGRPDAMTELRALLAARAPLYGQSDLEVETSGRSADETVDELAGRVASRLDRSFTTV